MMLKTEYEFIRFVEQEKPRERKTPRWSCVNKRYGDVLGTIAWLGRWRQFVFVPAGGAVFSSGCMQDIREFIGQLMQQRKAR